MDIEANFSSSNKQKIDEFDKKIERMLSFNTEDEQLILNLEEETQSNSSKLQKKEKNKIRMLVNLLIDLQLNKLESKLSYLEEFEKLIWYEKTELEVLQRMNIAERVNLAFKKNELVKQMSLAQTHTSHYHSYSGTPKKNDTLHLEHSDKEIQISARDKIEEERDFEPEINIAYEFDKNEKIEKTEIENEEKTHWKNNNFEEEK